MFVVCVFEDVNASGHIVVRHVKWDSFHFVFVVDGVFCQDSYEVRLPNQFKQNVHLIQFDTNSLPEGATDGTNLTGIVKTSLNVGGTTYTADAPQQFFGAKK